MPVLQELVWVFQSQLIRAVYGILKGYNFTVLLFYISYWMLNQIHYIKNIMVALQDTLLPAIYVSLQMFRQP